MSKYIQSESKKKILMHLIPILIIMVVGLINVSKINTITIIDDEFGYWGMGAQFAGLDWKSLLRETYFYSYGYGLLISPIIRFTSSMKIAYKVVALFNIMIIVMDYEIAFYALRRLVNRLSAITVAILALTITLTASNVFMIYMGTPEVLLCSLYWVVFLCFLKIIYDDSRIAIIILPIITIYMYSVHNRSIGVLITVALFLIYRLFVNIRNKHDIGIILVAVVLFVALFMAEEALRTYIVDNWYNSKELVITGKSEMNNYGTAGSIVKSIDSFKSIAFLILGGFGKLYSQIVSSFGACCICLGCVIVAIINVIFKKNSVPSECMVLLVFLTLGFMGEIGTNTLFYSGTPRNITAGRIIQGRYADFIAGPYILMAVVLIANKFINKAELVVSYVIAILTMLIVVFEIPYAYNNELMPYNNASLMPWFSKISVNRFGIAIVIIISTVIGTLLLLSLIKKKYFVLNILVPVVSIYLVIASLNLGEDYHVYKENKIEEYLAQIDDYVKNSDANATIFYLKTEEDTVGELEYIKLLQFLNRDKRIDVIYSIDDEYKGRIYMASSEANVARYSSDMDMLIDSGRIMILEKR